MPDGLTKEEEVAWISDRLAGCAPASGSPVWAYREKLAEEARKQLRMGPNLFHRLSFAFPLDVFGGLIVGLLLALIAAASIDQKWLNLPIAYVAAISVLIIIAEWIRRYRQESSDNHMRRSLATLFCVLIATALAATVVRDVVGHNNVASGQSPTSAPTPFPFFFSFERVEPDPNGATNVPRGTRNLRLVFGFMNASGQVASLSSCVLRYPLNGKIDEIKAVRFVRNYMSRQKCYDGGQAEAQPGNTGFIELNSYSLSPKEYQELRTHARILYFIGAINVRLANGESHATDVCVFNSGSGEVYLCRS